MKPAGLMFAIVTFLFSVSCSSGGLRIVESGFSAVETSPSRFVVKLESDELRSTEEATANLLVHSARWTIDHGGVYFTVSDRVEGSESGIDLEKASREDTGTGVPTVTQSQTGGYTSSTTGKRRTNWSLRATIRIYRDKPEEFEGTMYEASRVLDRYRALQTSGSSSRLGVSTNS